MQEYEAQILFWPVIHIPVSLCVGDTMQNEDAEYSN